MNFFALISLLSSLVTIFLGNFVYYKNPKNTLNKLFMLFYLSTAYLAFTEFGYRQADTFETAYFWIKASAFWAVAPSFLLHFALVFTEQSKLLNNKLTYLIIYAPGLILALLDWTTSLFPTELKKEYWGWTYSPPENLLLYHSVFAWIVGLALLAVYLCWRYYFKVTDRKKKQQAKYVLIGLSIPVIAGIITEWLLPVLQINMPELTTSAFTIEGIFIGYAIWKYELFTLTPEIVAESIIATISDFLLVVSPDATIISANKATLKLLGYQESELIGQTVDTIFAEEGEERDEKATPKRIGFAELIRAEVIIDVEATLKTKDGSNVPVSLSGSAMRDEDGRLQGIVCIGRDITERKRLEEAQARWQQEVIEAQRHTILELSTPVVPVLEKVLVLPLVGGIDAGRAQQIMATLLEAIGRYQAEVVLIDITGVPVVDTGVAHHLLQVTQAAALLGSECVLVGISPEVAQTIVSLEVDLSSIATRSDLQDGIEYALSRRGKGIADKKKPPLGVR